MELTEMAQTRVQLTIDEPEPGQYSPERVLLVCPRCGHPFLRHAAMLAHGPWSFPCPACTARLALNAMAGRSMCGPSRWLMIKSLVAA